ncbi:MAG: hypothetical protein ACI9S8_001315 [Chlamydiales bacterium]|jgi:hypothetical protein
MRTKVLLEKAVAVAVNAEANPRKGLLRERCQA